MNLNLIINLFVISFFLELNAKDWPRSYGDNESSRYSYLEQINEHNVTKLTKSWTYYFDKDEVVGRRVNKITPILIDNKLVTGSVKNKILALDPQNGKVIWSRKFKSQIGKRGFTSFQKGKKKIIVIPTSSGIIFLDSFDGSFVNEIGNNGLISYPEKTMKSEVPPIIYDNNLYIATLRNGVLGYNLDTGNLKWHTKIDSGNVFPRIWSGFSYDRKSNSLFVVTSNPDSIIGKNRKYEKDLSCSLISINASNGSINWHFQETRHDLWDYDLAGSPLLTDVNINGEKERAVIALSKTGQIIFLDIKNGLPIFEDSISEINVNKSSFNPKSSNVQINIDKPVRISSIEVNPETELRHLNEGNKDYLEKKMRWAQFDKYTPPSLDYDVVLKGLHGGPNRDGGAIDTESNKLFVSTNHETWILRVFYNDIIYQKLTRVFEIIEGSIKKLLNLKQPPKNALRWQEENLNFKFVDKIYSYIPIVGYNKKLRENCNSCHGVAGQGFIESESFGDKYYPSLTGISFTEKFSSMESLLSLQSSHYSKGFENLNDNDLSEIKNFIIRRDNLLSKYDLLRLVGRWQLLLNQDNLPVTQPPWGKIVSIDLETGQQDWVTPYGEVFNKENEFIAEGSSNFGGLLVTKGNVLFATGSSDKSNYALSTKNGKVLWRSFGEASGSTTPLTYISNNCQYVVFVETGGEFVGFENVSGAISAYTLPECIKDD